MFGFLKKDKDDEKKRKKERKDSKKSKERSGMTREELWRLDEARKSLTGKNKKKKEEEKLPSGITADYMEQFLSGMQTAETATGNSVQEMRDRYEAMVSGDAVSESSSDGVSLQSSEAASRRGILKEATPGYPPEAYSNDNSLLQNTSYNEMYENLAHHRVERAQSQTSIQDTVSYGSPLHESNGSMTISPRSPLSPFHMSPLGSINLTSPLSPNILSTALRTQGLSPPPPILPPKPVAHNSQITSINVPNNQIASINVPNNQIINVPNTSMNVPNIQSTSMNVPNNQIASMNVPASQSSQIASMNVRAKNSRGNLHPAAESVNNQTSRERHKRLPASLTLPPLEAVKAPPPRTLSIDRLPAGDFGFSLRRTQVRYLLVFFGKLISVSL